MPRSGARRQRWPAWGAAALLLFLPLSAGANSLEYPIKAAFLYKFAPFVQWPSLPAGPFTICVAGEDPFGTNLDEGVRNLTVEGRSIKIRRMPSYAPGAGCQILYVTATPEQSVAQALDLTRNMPILTVTEKDVPGSVIQFIVENNRVRFDIDKDAARTHGLTISSKLLSLARNIRARRE